MRFMLVFVFLSFGWLSVVNSTPPNVVVFTVDDMDYTTLNINGCPVPGLTPNMDRLAREGILFDLAHVPNAVCQPSRQSMMTGLHPHRYGACGFEPVPPGVPNLSELLMSNGWYTASFNKGRDYQSFKWNTFVDGYGVEGFGRDAGLFVGSAKKAIVEASAQKKPFFLNIATSDPHRPLAGSDQEKAKLAQEQKNWPKARAYFPDVVRTYTPQEAWVPPYLPDLPEIRKEWAQYYTSVHRADQTLGRILDLLQSEGLESTTMVIFYSDNGASFPTSKQNCYPYSTRTPLIIRWPAVIKAGCRDRQHLVTTMDLMPTVLDAANISLPARLDGRSLLSLFKGETQSGRDHVFTTQNYILPGVQVYPMRALQTRDYCYIFNAWSDGQTCFNGECHEGLSFAAIQKAAVSNSQMAKRLKQILYRVPEELYDLRCDPWCLTNRVNDSGVAEILTELKQRMESEMRQSQDPLLEKFLCTGEIPAEWLKVKKEM